VTNVNPVRRLRAWLAARPLVSDALFAGGILVLSLLGQGTGPDGGPVRATSPGAIALVVGCCVALVWRRRHPVAVWATILALGVIGIWVEQGITQSVLAQMVALYTVASMRPWRVAVAAALATV
jgi:hypothetical protein